MNIARFVSCFAVISRENSQLPRWYGVAYADVGSLGAWCYPIPLNFIVRWWRQFSCWVGYKVKVPPKAFTTWWEKLLRENYEQGYKAGYVEFIRDFRKAEERLAKLEQKPMPGRDARTKAPMDSLSYDESEGKWVQHQTDPFQTA